MRFRISLLLLAIFFALFACTQHLPAPGCTDDDSGRAYFTGSSASFSNGTTIPDRCIDGERLEEQTCGSPTARASVIYTCPYGCSNGACILPYTGDLVPKANGPDVEGMEGFDSFVLGFMKKWNLPGASLAVTKNGKLVYARGYGFADVGKNTPVTPESRFRIASLSKPITAAATLKLVEEGKLDLDTRAFEILGYTQDQFADGRAYDITIRQLLQHTGGWDRDMSYDPMGGFRWVAEMTHVDSPVGCPEILDYVVKNKKLDFPPGTRSAYSNFGYCVLGRVIENVSGEGYEGYIKTHVLAPMGITRMQLGNTLSRAENEVSYYTWPGANLSKSVFEDALVPGPYGEYYLEGMSPSGGWTGTPADYARFVTRIDGTGGHLFTPETEAAMQAPPDFWKNEAFYYGMGWFIWPRGDSATWTHSGAMQGVSSYVIRTYDGYTMVVFFSSWPREYSSQLFAEVDPGLWEAFYGVDEWPD